MTKDELVSQVAEQSNLFNVSENGSRDWEFLVESW